MSVHRRYAHGVRGKSKNRVGLCVGMWNASSAERPPGGLRGLGCAQDASGDLLKVVGMNVEIKTRGTNRGNAEHVERVQPASSWELEARWGRIARLPARALAYPRNGFQDAWKG